MKMLSPEIFSKYKSDPLKYDEDVRKFAGIPENRYYNVSMWPEEFVGRVYVRTPTAKDKAREVKNKKISKSDQT